MASTAPTLAPLARPLQHQRAAIAEHRDHVLAVADGLAERDQGALEVLFAIVVLAEAELDLGQRVAHDGLDPRVVGHVPAHAHLGFAHGIADRRLLTDDLLGVGLQQHLLEDVDDRFGPSRLQHGRVAFAARDAEGRDERDQHERRGAGEEAMSGRELARQVPRRRWMRGDGLAPQIAADVIPEGSGRRVALVRLATQCLADDRLQLTAQAAIGMAETTRRTLTDAARGVEARKAAEIVRQLPGQHLEQQHTERPDVGAGVDAADPALELLGAHVRQRADAMVDLGVFGGVDALAIDQARDAEVDDLDLAFGGDEHVAGLEIAMYDAATVRVLDGRADRDEQLEPRVAAGRGAAQPEVEPFAVHQLHGKERSRLTAGDVGSSRVNARDAGVFEPRQHLAFEFEAPQRRRRRQAAAQHLQRDAAARRRLLRGVDDAHAADAEHVQHAKPGHAGKHLRRRRHGAALDGIPQLRQQLAVGALRLHATAAVGAAREMDLDRDRLVGGARLVGVALQQGGPETGGHDIAGCTLRRPICRGRRKNPLTRSRSSPAAARGSAPAPGAWRRRPRSG